MPNHWHLLLRPGSAEALPPFMRRLTLAHSRRWQACHDRPGQGTLYQGRYRSARVESDVQLLTVLRYIERNPVRAGLVARAIDWPWSSLRQRLSGRAGRLAALLVPLPAGWLAHVDAPQTAAEVVAVRRAVSGGSAGRPRRAGRGSGYRTLIELGTVDRTLIAPGTGDRIRACRDPKDDKFLEVAVNVEADFLISGDRDLVDLHPFRGISILTPAEFLAPDA